MKIIFMGTPEFAVPSLEALVAAKHQVVMVVTNPDRRRGRGNKLLPPAVKVAALKHNLPVHQPEKADAALRDFLAPLEADLSVVVAYGQYLERSLRKLPRFNTINVHASLLPRHRGASPISAAIIAGDPYYGVTIMEVARRMDAGKIYAQRSIPAANHHTCGSLTESLSKMGAELLVEAIADIEQERANPQEQDESRATTAGKLAKADGFIDWKRPGDELERLIRGLHPWPKVRFHWKEKVVIVEKAELLPERSDGAPGTVVAIENDGIIVATGSRDAVVLREVKPMGKRAMSAMDFVRGRSIQPGELFNNG